MKKTVFKKGFTLIELMIVIVILGVLMGTILPRLTGAQARARDTGRIADMNTISQALETYFDDNGIYPGTQGTMECLEVGKTSYEAIKVYLKGEAVPTPSASQVNGTSATATENCTGSYAYIPLANKGINANGYVLISDVETYQKANVILTHGDLTVTPTLTWPMAAPFDTTTIGTAITNTTTASLKTADDENAGTTAYVVYN